MKKVLKSLLFFSSYLFYLLIMDWVLGLGIKDTWDKITKQIKS